VTLAELKAGEIDPPTLEGNGYKIAVYGIPATNTKGDPKSLGDPLKKNAVLRRDGKKDVKPLRVEVSICCNCSNWPGSKKTEWGSR